MTVVDDALDDGSPARERWTPQVPDVLRRATWRFYLFAPVLVVAIVAAPSAGDEGLLDPEERGHRTGHLRRDRPERRRLPGAGHADADVPARRRRPRRDPRRGDPHHAPVPGGRRQHRPLPRGHRAGRPAAGSPRGHARRHLRRGGAVGPRAAHRDHVGRRHHRGGRGAEGPVGRARPTRGPAHRSEPRGGADHQRRRPARVVPGGRDPTHRRAGRALPPGRHAGAGRHRTPDPARGLLDGVDERPGRGGRVGGSRRGRDRRRRCGARPGRRAPQHHDAARDAGADPRGPVE